MRYTKALLAANSSVGKVAPWPTAWRTESLISGERRCRLLFLPGLRTVRFCHAANARSGTRGFFTATQEKSLPNAKQDAEEVKESDFEDLKKQTALREIEDALSTLKNNTLMQYDKVFHFLPSADYNEPMVMLLGNHSSGKSTFINHLLGRNVQQTGVAPTDDGFTIIRRGSKDLDEDGPSVLSDPRYQLKELQTFGPHFVHRFKMKTRQVPDESRIPPGLMIVDTPGMIDTPTHVQDRTSLKGQMRGYDFLGVTRWFAKRCDVILLMFDPANPGTTGETLDVLTRSLSGFEHKFLVLMNKVDVFSKATDFARAYGALCWNLSKVLHMKDMPRIYTTFIALGASSGPNSSATNSSSPSGRAVSSDFSALEFVQQRQEVVDELLRAPLRRLDNLITETEEGARRILLAGLVGNALVWDMRRRQAASAAAAAAATAAAVGLLYAGGAAQSLAAIACVATAGSVAGFATAFKVVKAYEKEKMETCDSVVDRLFMGRERTVDLLLRWKNAVKPEIENLAAVSAASDVRIVSALPVLSPWGRKKITSALNNDIPQLRLQVAKFKEIYHTTSKRATVLDSSNQKGRKG